MGYDMYCRGESHPEADKARQAFEDAGGWPDQELGLEVRQAALKRYEEFCEAEIDSGQYFRLNIFGMSKYSDAMFGIGMAHAESSNEVWPQAPDDLDWDVYYENPSSYPEYRTKLEDFLSASADAPGIDLRKFGSNDGWIVTPDECREAVAIWDEIGSLPFQSAEENAYWMKWIGFLRHCGEHGGFTVH